MCRDYIGPFMGRITVLVAVAVILITVAVAIVVLWRMGGVDRDCGRGHPFFPAMAGCDMALNHVLPYGMGGLLQCVADEATHLYPHFFVPWG